MFWAEKNEPWRNLSDYDYVMKNKYRPIGFNELVTRYQRGDRNALMLLIKRYHPVMMRKIRYGINEPEPVNDIAQECWYAIISRLESLELRISFEAWAATIVRRKTIDWIRHQQRQRRQHHTYTRHNPPCPESQDDEPDSSEEKKRKVQAGIRLLPPTQKLVITLFYLDNLSLEEISSRLDISVGTVKSRLFYAREKLKKIISDT